jgi:CO/xanthine dehydrogenase Mo-binding subunit
LQFARAMRLPEEHIRVNVVAVGGDFGGKGDARDLPIAYLLAKMAQRPVKIVMSYGEELTASNPTHPTVVTIRSGVTRDGRLTARQVRTVHASGAYGAMKPRSFLSTSHYVGDLLARELGMDPAAFRLKNLLGPGEEDAIGRPLRVADVRQVLEAALEAGQWGEPKAGPDRGKGVAIFGRQIGGGPAGAVLTAEADGTFTVLSPTVDVGTGTHTIEQQIVATEMDVPLSWVRVRQGDTDSTPFDEGPRASRVTYTEGQAVMQACAQMRQAIADGATLPLTITAEHDAPQPEDVMYFSAQVAEVEVDRETGQVKVINVVTAHDVGTVINPLTHQGQIDGGFVTGLGLAMTEELVSEDGQILNGHLGEYKLPTMADIPPLKTVLVPTSGGQGPYQAKAIGELANNATAAAIANAIADAVGCQPFELPITAEMVYTALHQD